MIANRRPEGDDEDVPSEMVAALGHTRRRAVVELLHSAGGTLSLARLASRLAADSEDMLPDVVIELHDLHLPELSHCGLVEYEDDTGMVTLDANRDVVEAALAHLQEEDP